MPCVVSMSCNISLFGAPKRPCGHVISLELLFGAQKTPLWARDQPRITFWSPPKAPAGMLSAWNDLLEPKKDPCGHVISLE